MAAMYDAAAEAHLNSVLSEDQKRPHAVVDTFRPDASPEEKAAEAGKRAENLGIGGGQKLQEKELAISAATSPAMPPTITVTKADGEPKNDEPKVSPHEPPRELPGIPGSMSEALPPAIPDWYKVGWRAVSGVDIQHLTEGEEKDKAVLDMFLNEIYYGAWYHNAAVIIFAVVVTHFLTLFRFGWGWIFILLAICATYFSTSMARFRRCTRDDIQRELVKTRLGNETESADWMNHFLERFWLIYEPVLTQTIVATADQILSQNTPVFLDSLRITSFTLGTKAPRIRSVLTWPHTEEDIVTMDWAVSFTPNDASDMTPKEAARKVNPKIVLSIRVGKGVASTGMPVLLEDMSFTGLIRVRLKLMTKFPHIQAADISFLECPTFDYVLKPIGGEMFGFDVGFIPGLHSFIREMVHDTLKPMMYSPNVFTLNLEQLLSGAPIDSAIGVIQVTVLSARGLKGTKIGGGASDPYVTLSISGREVVARTGVKPSTQNPDWNESKFILINSLTDTLNFSIFDWNEHRKDSHLGSASFGLSKLLEDAKQEGIEAKILRDGKERGELRFDVSYYPVLKPQEEGGKPMSMPETKVGIVRVTLHQAKELDHTIVSSSDMNPIAKIFLMNNAPPIHITPKVRHTLNPVWDSSTEYLCFDKHSSTVTVKIYDDRDILKDPMVGYASIRLEDLLEAKVTSKDWWPLSGCRTGRVRAAAEWKPLNMPGSVHGVGSYSPPIGIVRLWMQKATDVKNVEAVHGGKSDPYVRVLVNNTILGRTDVINNNLNPEWDQIIYIPVHSLKETMLLECMDYQNLTKDRSLGNVELKVSDLARRADDIKYPYVSIGKKAFEEPIRVGTHSYKGQLHYTAEFVPAIALKNISFASRNEVQRIADRVEDHHKLGGSLERGYDRVPEGASERTGSIQTESTKELAGSAKENAKKNSIDSVHTAESSKVDTVETAESYQSHPSTPGVEIPQEELLAHQSGIIILNVIRGRLSHKGRLEVLLDDGYWPAFSTIRARSIRAEWDHVGEGFIKELDFGRIWLRLNENEEGEKDDVISEFKCDARQFLEKTIHGPAIFTLVDQDGKHPSTVELECRYVPVDITLEPRESINNMGVLRVDLLKGEHLRAADRGGKSDPFVVFMLNNHKVFKSQVKKKTLSPEWNENFVVQVPSRVAADFWLEVLDWNQIEQAKSLGSGKIDLSDLEPFKSTERTIKLHSKEGEQGDIHIRIMFTPEIIARYRKNTSTFTSAGRAMTQISAIPLEAGRGVFHGVNKVGQTIGHVFAREATKSQESLTAVTTQKYNVQEPAIHVAGPSDIGKATKRAALSQPGANDEHVGPEPGTLKVTVVKARDLPSSEDLKPYVVVRVGEKEHRTKHTGKTVSPEWNETFSFPAGQSTPILHIKVFDYKTLGKGRQVAEIDMDIWQHLQSGRANLDTPLNLSDGHGELTLRLQFEPLPMGRASSTTSTNRGPFGSPSRFSLSKKLNHDE